MNSSIVSEKEPVKRCNKPSLYWIISHGIISLRDYLHLEGETPSPGIEPWKKPPALQGDLSPWKVRVTPKPLNVSWRCRVKLAESRRRDGFLLGEKKPTPKPTLLENTNDEALSCKGEQHKAVQQMKSQMSCENLTTILGEIFSWRKSAINHLIFSFALPFGKMLIIFHWSLLQIMCIYSWGFPCAACTPRGGGDGAEMLPYLDHSP